MTPKPNELDQHISVDLMFVVAVTAAVVTTTTSTRATTTPEIRAVVAAPTKIDDTITCHVYGFRYTRSDMYQDVILSLWYRRCREMVRNSVELVDFSDTTLIQRMQFSHHMSWSHSRRKWSFGGLQRIFKRHDENIVLNPPHMRVLSRKTQRTSHMQKSL